MCEYVFLRELFKYEKRQIDTNNDENDNKNNNSGRTTINRES